MRFTIDKEARRAYLWTDTAIEEISLKQIFAHIVAPMPSTVRYCERQEREGLQKISAHIEFLDTSSRGIFGR